MSKTDYTFLYSKEDDFALRRQESKSGFRFLNERNAVVRDRKTLTRIQELVIPPNWQQVRICVIPDGHIQAFGFDDRGRKQYIYHPLWLEQRNRQKFDGLAKFAKSLPKIRKKAYRDVRKRKWTREKTLGLVVLTLDEVYIRIGNLRYMQENDTFGLTTLRRKHLYIEDDGISFQYKAKRGKYRKVSLHNNQLVKLIKKCSELPGYEVFRYQHGDGYRCINSADVNDYLKKASKLDCTAKDFRTWAGTKLAVELMPKALQLIAENPRRKLSTTLVKLVAERLGNTVAICRDHYIHPAVLRQVEKGNHKRLLFRNHRGGMYALSACEKKTLEIITGKYN